MGFDYAVHSKSIWSKLCELVIHHGLENVKPVRVGLQAILWFLSINGINQYLQIAHFRPST